MPDAFMKVSMKLAIVIAANMGCILSERTAFATTLAPAAPLALAESAVTYSARAAANPLSAVDGRPGSDEQGAGRHLPQCRCRAEILTVPPIFGSVRPSGAPD